MVRGVPWRMEGLISSFGVPVPAVEGPSSSDEVTWQEIFDDSELKKYVPSGNKRSILYFFISSRLCLDTLTQIMLIV